VGAIRVAPSVLIWFSAACMGFSVPGVDDQKPAQLFAISNLGSTDSGIPRISNLIAYS